MLKTTINKLLMFIYYIVGALILEAVTFHILDLGVGPEYFWYNFSIILFLAVMVFIIPNYTAQYIFYTIILTVQIVFVYVNYSLSMVYGDLFSIDMIHMLEEAGAAMTSNFVYFSVILQLVSVYLAIVILGGLFLKFCRTEKINLKQHFSVFNVIIFIVIQCFSSGYFVNTRANINNVESIASSNEMVNDKFLMNTSFLKFRSYSKFGTYGYFANIIANEIRNEGDAVKNMTVDYFNSGNIYNSSEVFGVDKGNNVIVIMMESLEWFGFGDGTYDKELNNLSYELTPNMYSLIYGDDYLTDMNNENLNNDAMISTNFFAKSKTNISEGQGIIGNYPVGQSLTEIVQNDTEIDRTIGYAMPNVLRNLGYTTTYVHSHNIAFYDRNKTHHQLGFDTVVGKNDVKDEEGNFIYTGDNLAFHNWAPEGEFAQQVIDYIVPENHNEKPFYTFYLNVSSHGPYTAVGNENDGDRIRYFDYVRYGEDDCIRDEFGNWKLNVNESEATPTNWYANVLKSNANNPELCLEMVYYQCGVKGLDDAIGIIVNKLKNYGIEDETTLLLYADHYAYYEGLTNKIKGFDLNDYTSRELNTIPMIISSPGLKEKNTTLAKYLENNRFCSAYDVVPTMFDLLGVEFNENLYLGHSLFRPADYVYEVGEDEMRDMVVYYSNTGGLFSYDVYSFDLNTFISQGHIDNSVIEMFKAESNLILTKINYLMLLNRYRLYQEVTNLGTNEIVNK